MDAQVARALDRSRAGEPLDAAGVEAILRCPDADLDVVLARARELRDEGLRQRGLDGIVTYSRKVFIPLTHLCRYRCSYCTFVKTRAEGTLYLTPDEVVAIATAGREWGCTEALFTLGEAPELRHDEAKRWLADRGYATTVDYLIEAARTTVIKTGLLPHANPGAITQDEMQRLRDVSASQGVMMEQLTDRLLAPGEAHAGAPGKAAAIRLEQLELAHRTRTPFTTGLLIGIGETTRERAETIVQIRDADEGQIQEVIVQNFRAKPDTPMRAAPDAEEQEMVRAIAATRIALGPLTPVQAPPNLTPRTYGAYLDAGIDDWGGVSPVTPDHVNPEMPWPAIEELFRTCQRKGFTLRQRLPVYPEFVNEGWISAPMWRHVLAASDAMGLAREERWYAGEGWTPVLRQAQPIPKRRALAIASSKPELAAEDVYDAATAGCGDAGGNGHVGFDAMLPDIPGRTVLAHERIADQSWLAPYKARAGTVRVADLLEKAHQGERLELDEVERLFRSEGADLSAIIEKADEIRREMHGDTVTYVVNRNITYTNFCHTGCGFCGFARPVGHEDGYYFSPDDIGAKVREAWDRGATEVCIQGGIHPRNDGRVYLDIARAVKDAVPQMHLHGFSPLEVTVGARTLGLTLDAYIPMLRDAGLDTMPGTAAEILDGRVRVKLTPEKLSAEDWLEVMRTAHRSGIQSTTTIMFGHVDDPGVWAYHLLRLRDLQAETGGFTEFIPLPFVHHRSPIHMRGDSRSGPTWREAIKMHAIGRIVLHPLFTNIQASWVKLGPDGVVALLDGGVNDFGGTLMEEHISRMAGASHGIGLTPEQIEGHIIRAGRKPRQRTTTYDALGV
jgi:FO synthase